MSGKTYHRKGGTLWGSILDLLISNHAVGHKVRRGETVEVVARQGRHGEEDAGVADTARRKNHDRSVREGNTSVRQTQPHKVTRYHPGRARWFSCLAMLTASAATFRNGE